MKITNLALAGLFAALPAHAATILASDPAAGGIGYEWQVTLGGNDSGTTPNIAGSHVGAWSWEDEGVFDPGDPTAGWTHTSNWAAITLTADAYVTVRVEANGSIPFTGTANVGGFRPTDNFYPSFTLYAGWDNDEIPPAVAALLGADPSDGEFHTYNNRGNIDWAEDLTFIGLKENTTEHFAEATWYLPAGNYTLAIGSNAPSETNPPRQGYGVTFTSVPEPSAALLGVLSLGALVARRRR